MDSSRLLRYSFPGGTAHLRRRLVQLYIGLLLFGFSGALLVLAGLGLGPWDVLHQGLARHSPLAIGTWVVIVSGAVLLLWIPLRQVPGLGTLSNAVLVGLSMNWTLALLHPPSPLLERVCVLLAGVLLNGVATGLYIGAGMGPGPRDGLMMGLAKRGLSIRVARTGIELTVLAVGFLLGGSVGIGTLLYALAIGPLSHALIPRFAVGQTDGAQTEPAPETMKAATDPVADPL